MKYQRPIFVLAVMALAVSIGLYITLADRPADAEASSTVPSIVLSATDSTISEGIGRTNVAMTLEPRPKHGVWRDCYLRATGGTAVEGEDYNRGNKRYKFNRNHQWSTSAILNITNDSDGEADETITVEAYCDDSSRAAQRITNNQPLTSNSVTITITDDDGGLPEPAPEPEDPASGDGNGGVCDREPAIRDAIVAAVGDDVSCGSVTTEQLAGIIYLRLFDATVASVTSGDFDGLDGLTTLTFCASGYDSLPGGLFKGLDALTKVTICNNPALGSVPDDLFDGVAPNLKRISFYGNGLTVFPKAVFENTSAVVHLDLANNGMTTLPENAFENLGSLWYLVLEGNPWDYDAIPDDVFDDLTNLVREDSKNRPLFRDFAEFFD